jgi:hypothetical protein
MCDALVASSTSVPETAVEASVWSLHLFVSLQSTESHKVSKKYEVVGNQEAAEIQVSMYLISIDKYSIKYEISCQIMLIQEAVHRNVEIQEVRN